MSPFPSEAERDDGGWRERGAGSGGCVGDGPRGAAGKREMLFLNLEKIARSDTQSVTARPREPRPWSPRSQSTWTPRHRDFLSISTLNTLLATAMDSHHTADERGVALRRIQRIVSTSNPNVAGSLAQSHFSTLNSSRALSDRGSSSAEQSPFSQHAAAMLLWWTNTRDAVLDLTKEVQEQVRVQAVRLITLQLARINTFNTPPKYDANGWRVPTLATLSINGQSRGVGKGKQRHPKVTPDYGTERTVADAADEEFRQRVRAALLSGANDISEAFRSACLRALGLVCKPGDEEALLCLGSKLGDGSDGARLQACNALARLGAEVRHAVC